MNFHSKLTFLSITKSRIILLNMFHRRSLRLVNDPNKYMSKFNLHITDNNDNSMWEK